MPPGHGTYCKGVAGGEIASAWMPRRSSAHLETQAPAGWRYSPLTPNVTAGVQDLQQGWILLRRPGPKWQEGAGT